MSAGRSSCSAEVNRFRTDCRSNITIGKVTVRWSESSRFSVSRRDKEDWKVEYSQRNRWPNNSDYNGTCSNCGKSLIPGERIVLIN